MTKTLIFGHKNPDTDSICSAIAYAALKTKLGEDVEAVRLGELNPETSFVLSEFNTPAPRQVTRASDEASRVILVDHNERQQSVEDLGEVEVVEVIDHHRIANFETSQPLYYRAEPVGCTATILYKMYIESGVAIAAQTAGLMLSAIVSDTLLLKSPTCTTQDVEAVRALALLAGVDVDAYGLEMLKAGADLRGKSVDDLLQLDAKEFQMGAYQVEIAQVNAVDTADVLVHKPALEEKINAVIASKGLDLFLFVVTDILTNDSVALAFGREVKAVEAAYGVTLVENQATLHGVVSRKKQIVPILTDTFAART